MIKIIKPVFKSNRTNQTLSKHTCATVNRLENLAGDLRATIRSRWHTPPSYSNNPNTLTEVS